MCIVLLPPGVNPGAVNKYIYLISFLSTLSPQAFTGLLLHHNQSRISNRHRGWEIIIIIIIINIVIICYFMYAKYLQLLVHTWSKQTMFLGYTT